MDIIIDTRGDADLANRERLLESDDDDDVEVGNIGNRACFRYSAQNGN